MAVFWVAQTGDENGHGGLADPLPTISSALLRATEPGDVVVVMAGTYVEQLWIWRGGTPGAPLVIRSEWPGAARVRPPEGVYSTVNVRADHVTFDGFDVVGGDGHAIDVESARHVAILNSVAHHSGGSGIQYNWSDFIMISGNAAFANAATNGYHTSGISVYQPRAAEGDGADSGYRIVVTNNVSYGNVESPAITDEHTDGNGIIIDDFRSTQKPEHPPYPFRTLVAGNLLYGNGGKGVAVHWSDHVDVVNNTAFRNNLDGLNPGEWRGELSNLQSGDNRWINNIAVADPRVNPYNTAIADVDYGSYANRDLTWTHNLTFDGRPGAPSARMSDGRATPAAEDENRLGVDPLFIDAAAGDFRLGAGSPAVDAGAAMASVLAVDVAGRPRLVGAPDIGAYERGAVERDAVNRPPLALADSGFRVEGGGVLRIPGARLLSNDSDPDGDALAVSALGAAAHGAARIEDGAVVFEAHAGYAGPARVAYAAADGHGGLAWAPIALDVVSRHADPPPGATLFDAAQRPETTIAEGGQSYELGVRFTPNDDATVATIRYWRGEADAEDVDARDLTLWDADGAILSRTRVVSLPGETGWRAADLPEPIPLKAGAVYVASYATDGHYAFTESFFAGGVTQAGGVLATAQTGVFSDSDGAGGGPGTFPTRTWRASNYWIDVVFDTAGQVLEGVVLQRVDGTEGFPLDSGAAPPF